MLRKQNDSMDSLTVGSYCTRVPGVNTSSRVGAVAGYRLVGAAALINAGVAAAAVQLRLRSVTA